MLHENNLFNEIRILILWFLNEMKFPFYWCLQIFFKHQLRFLKIKNKNQHIWPVVGLQGISYKVFLYCLHWFRFLSIWGKSIVNSHFKNTLVMCPHVVFGNVLMLNTFKSCFILAKRDPRKLDLVPDKSLEILKNPRRLMVHKVWCIFHPQWLIKRIQEAHK